MPRHPGRPRDRGRPPHSAGHRPYRSRARRRCEADPPFPGSPKFWCGTKAA